MRPKYLFVVFLFVVTIMVSAANGFVPPPAPKIVDGPAVAIGRKVNGLNHIIHIKRDSAAPFTQYVGDYLVKLECSGENPLRLDLRPLTSPVGSPNEELVFLTLPKNSEDKCTLTVTSRNVYPWQKRFSGLISSIPLIEY